MPRQGVNFLKMNEPFLYDDFGVQTNKFNKTWLSIQTKKWLEVGFY